MNFFTIGFYYISWHYTRGIRDLIGVFMNLIWFTWHYFSIVILFKTLLSPFKRLTEKYKGGLDLEKFFESLVVNTLMRAVGAFLRIIVISIGILASVGMTVLGMVSVLVWIVLPLMLTFLIITSLLGLFN